MEDKVEKMRLDIFLVKKGLSESRSKAQQMIERGSVKVNGVVCKDSSKKVTDRDLIDILEAPKYVSRAGYKLEGLFNRVKIALNERIACDIGSSTGGFTDFLLQNGVKKVYAVDVNTDQLHEKLSNDSRVIKIKKNARDLSVKDIGEQVDIVTTDVSFISVRKLRENIYNVLLHRGCAIILIKPQFEVGYQHSGIIKRKDKHVEVLSAVLLDFMKVGFVLKALDYSKILGSDGNIEFFAVFEKSDSSDLIEVNHDDIMKIVDLAWEEHYKCTES